MVKSTSLFTWTDDEVQLLLKVTNEYKVSKTAEGVDWESVQRKYSDILDRFREEKQSPKLHARFTILNWRIQISRHNGNRTQIDIVLLFAWQMIPSRFENAPFLAAFSNRAAFGNMQSPCHVNRRHNRIRNYAVTNETCFCSLVFCSSFLLFGLSFFVFNFAPVDRRNICRFTLCCFSISATVS